MFKKSYVNLAKTFSILPVCLLSNSVVAKPWLDPGDIRLRHELQLLSDSGMLDAPITTWPLATKDIEANLNDVSEGETIRPELQDALNNIQRRLAEENNRKGYTIEVNARSKELLIRDFSGEGLGKGAISYDGDWGKSYFDARLKASVADKSQLAGGVTHPNDKTLRLDESYIATDLKNWKFTVGQQSRYWGPGWDGSLIMSNNARPFPSISVENVLSKHKAGGFLSRWIGNSKLHAFIGQLESDRGIPNAKIIGTRLTIRPHKSFELGLHRTLQWGGEGGADDGLFDTLFGLSANSKDDLLAGNSIAGLDARWNLPFGGRDKHYSLYTQYIGEDRAVGSIFLGDEIFKVGGSVAGYTSKLKGSWRAYLEATDTSAGSFKGRPGRNNIVYNHGSYSDGYRYQDVSMGHGVDSDSKQISAGLILNQTNGNLWRGWVKHAKLNEDGIGKNPISPDGRKWSALGVSLDKKLNNDSNANIGIQLISDRVDGSEANNDVAISFGYTKSF